MIPREPIKAAAAALAMQGEGGSCWLCSPAKQPAARGGNPPPLPAPEHSHTGASLASVTFVHNLPNPDFA